jgi:hypothetical protein
LGKPKPLTSLLIKHPKVGRKKLKTTWWFFSKIDGSSWSQIMVYKNTISKGSIQKDFDSEWQELVVEKLRRHFET